jgi:hypothetical protein
MESKNKGRRGAPRGNKNASGNKGGKGKETLYRPKFVQVAEKMCHLGLTDQDLADFFEVSRATVIEWKKRFPAFGDAVKQGKLVADAEVASKLYQRAIGYKHKEEKIFQYKGKPVVVKTVKRYPPDPVAAKFWLTNRQKELWKDRQDHTIDFNSMTDDELDQMISKITKISSKK